jgi:hypothetical protein
VDAPLQQGIVGEAETRDKMRSTTGRFFGLGEEVIRISLE